MMPHSPLRSDFCPKFARKLVHNDHNTMINIKGQHFQKHFWLLTSCTGLPHPARRVSPASASSLQHLHQHQHRRQSRSHLSCNVQKQDTRMKSGLINYFKVTSLWVFQPFPRLPNLLAFPRKRCLLSKSKKNKGATQECRYLIIRKQFQSGTCLHVV